MKLAGLQRHTASHAGSASGFTPASLRARVIKIVSPHGSIAPAGLAVSRQRASVP